MKARSGRCFVATAASVVLAIVSAVAADNVSSLPQDVFDRMRESFQASKAAAIHLRYQWELSGPAGGQWWVEVNDGKCEMGKGKIDNPDTTFIASDKDWVALSNGTLGGTWAYLTGRLKIQGDKKAARKLGEMFP